MKKTTAKDATKKQAKPNEIHIKENVADDEFFREQRDPYVLPPELNMTVRDGFRFGVGFILAMLLFYTIAGIAIALIIRFGNVIKF